MFIFQYDKCCECFEKSLKVNALQVPVWLIVQALISVQALVFDLAQLTCQKRFDCRNAILGSSVILLGTSYS